MAGIDVLLAGGVEGRRVFAGCEPGRLLAAAPGGEYTISVLKEVAFMEPLKVGVREFRENLSGFLRQARQGPG
jgi:hypothetical protein